MGRNGTYKRQRAHVMRENPRFFELGENGSPPNREAVAEEFNRLLADNAYGRNPKAGADRPEGGVILTSPVLKVVDMNKPADTGIGAGVKAHSPGEATEKVKKELGAKPKAKRPPPADLMLEPKDDFIGSMLKDVGETPTTPGFDWAADLAAHSTSPEKPVQGDINERETAPETFAEEDGWSTVRSKGSARAKRATVVDSTTENRGCFNCGEEGHRKADCTAPPKSGGRACHNCGEEGHFARECPTQGGGDGGSFGPSSGRACHNCGEEGHFARECPTQSGGGGSGFGPTSGRACHNCGEEGHFARECPTQGEGGGSFGPTNNRVCYNCNHPGHIARDCPTGGPGKGGAECFNCGEIGHKSFECSKSGGSYGPTRFGTTGGRGGRRGPSTCHSCGQAGHFARECPMGTEGGFEPFPSFDNTGFDTAYDTGFDSGYATGFDSVANDDGYGW